MYDIYDDVDLIYDLYFKKDVEVIGRTGKINRRMFGPDITNTEILRSEQGRKGHEINPCVILINDSKFRGTENYFDPTNHVISVSVSKPAFNYVIDSFSGDYGEAIEYNGGTLISEFKEHRIKGSIAHELSHWLDQTFNNKSVERLLKHRIKNREKIKTNVNTDHIEINSQIAGIVQARKHFSKSEWDYMTFNELSNIVVPLNSVNNMLRGDEKTKWKRDLKQRMYREGLLGNNMYN